MAVLAKKLSGSMSSSVGVVISLADLVMGSLSWKAESFSTLLALSFLGLELRIHESKIPEPLIDSNMRCSCSATPGASKVGKPLGVNILKY